MSVTPPNSGFAAHEKILLYYPTIDIPSPRWIRQGLMYWDKIGSIVPNSYDAQLPKHLRYSDQIQPLYNAGLFHPFNPEALFYKDGGTKIIAAFESELLKTVDSGDFLGKLPPQRTYDAEVYVEKVNDYLYQQLLDRKLVAPRTAGDIIYFTEEAAFVYMAILAKYLADIDDQLAVPSTDLTDYESLNFEALEGEHQSIPSVRVEFRDVLRVPADNVEIERIVDFRLKHNQELLNFRHEVLDKFEDEIKKAADRREIKDKTVRFRSQVEKGIDDLDLLMKGAKFQTVTGTLKAIFKPEHITTALTSTVAATGAAVATGGALLPTAIAGMVGLAGGGAIELFDFFVSRKNARQEKLSSNAYSYLYLAEKEFGSS